MKDFLLKRPSAWIPIVMSLTALILVIVYAVIFGVSQNPQEDEGVAARIFQLLLIGQLPVISYFVIRWAGSIQVRRFG